MELSFAETNSCLIVNIEGDLDLHTAEHFKQQVDEKITAGNHNLILNFTQVNFVDSSGIGAILSKYKQLNNLGGKLVIANISPQIKRIFEVSGILRVIDIYSSEKEAVKKIAKGEKDGE
jgi:stage II sporulation protein AA (anti-sigma F factor antagonist)